MCVRSSAVRTLLLLGLFQLGHRGLASAPELKAQPRKIAIIGAGIGGTAAAYFLRQELGPDVKIEVFEADTVGGRLATEEIEGEEYESGGSIIHPLNLHMKHLVDKLGLSVRTAVPSKMAIFDGKELTFEESDWFIINFIRMLWHYGLNAIRMNMWVEGVLDKFMRIYQYQQFGYSFTSMERMLHAMGGDSFLKLLNQTLEETLLAEGFSQAFMNEFVTPILRVNYLQTLRMGAFVGAVAVAGADPGLWSVDGGNKKVCAGLLYNSKAELIPARVTSVSLKTRPSRSGPVSKLFELSYVGQSGSAHGLYDMVVVAAPLHQDMSDISFSGFSPAIPNHFPGRFHSVVTTLVQGQLDLSYLGISDANPDHFRVTDILTTDNKELAIQSLSAVQPVHIPPGHVSKPANARVWKIFSERPVPEKHLGEIFKSVRKVREKRWLAYPTYVTPQRSPTPFILHDGLYYLSGIEWAASCMEMSVLSARNVALLARHHWHGEGAKIDQEDLHSRLRGEL